MFVLYCVGVFVQLSILVSSFKVFHIVNKIQLFNDIVHKNNAYGIIDGVLKCEE